ncbi:MAG: hypothetical protein HYZ13_08610 [Acidobacteria bacterium]|nr:hypothetical protein [Acidobacteriota bacterium]
MHRTHDQSFRVFLHLGRMQARRESMAVPSDEAEVAPTEALDLMARSLDRAGEARTRKDWLGFETELLRLASETFRALEAHQRRIGCGTFHARTRWCWESLSNPGAAGSWPTRAQAVAQAESELPPGDSYRVGRLAPSPLHRYVPKTEWLLGQMRDRARLEHAVPDLEWPQLDFQQHQELQGYLEGLMVAFLEREGLTLALAQWVDMEVHQVSRSSPAAVTSTTWASSSSPTRTAP